MEPRVTPWAPHPYQQRAVDWLIEHQSAALFLSPGLGKTSITLAAIQRLRAPRRVNKVLIIAPLRVCHSVWPAERDKWAQFADLRIEILHGPRKADALQRDADIYLVNPEGLDWLIGRDGGKQFRAARFDALVIDELSKFKAPSIKRFKLLKQTLSSFRYRWGLTGSPAANSLMDLFGECLILDGGAVLGKYITHFRAQYFVPGFDGFSWLPQKGAAERIYESVARLALRMDAADYLDLPEQIDNLIYVDLPRGARKVYKDVEDDLIARVRSHVVTASNAGVAVGKCRQIASGAVYVEPDATAVSAERSVVHVHDAKIEALIDLIEDLHGAPVLVLYEYQHDLDRLREVYDAPHIGAGVSTRRTAEIIDAWNAGRLPILYGHPQSMGHGLNLQGGGQHICWFSLPWSYEAYDQTNCRLRRQGSTHEHIHVHHILARGTVDEIVLGALRAKETGQKALFSALLAHAGLQGSADGLGDASVYEPPLTSAELDRMRGTEIDFGR